MLNNLSPREIKRQAERFNRYWISVSDDLKNLADALTININKLIENNDTNTKKIMIEIWELKKELREKR